MNHNMDYLHQGVFWLCIVVGIVTFIALFYSIITFRRSKDKEHGPLGFEILWMAIPVLILVLLVIPMAKLFYSASDHSLRNASPKAIAPLKPLSKKTLMELGRAGYGKYCSVCHQSHGQGLPPSFPSLQGGPVSTGPVKQHINIVLNGKPGTTMQAFRHQLDATTLAAIITYERNAWGNAAIVKKNGHQLVVQPSDIVKAEK